MADIPLLSGALNGLEYYQREVIDDKILGQALRFMNRPEARMLMPPQMRGLGAMLSPATADADAARAQGLKGKAWVDEAYKNSPWQHFAAGAVLDPTNAIGFGLPGMGAKAVAKAPLLGRELATALRAANVVDQLPGKVTGKGLDLVGQGLKGGLQLGADALGPLVPHNPALDKIGNAFKFGTQLWRDQALISPPFHMGNYVGNLEAAGRAGQWDVLREAAMGPLRGRNKQTGDILTSLGNNRAPLAYAAGGPPPVPNPASFGQRWSGNMEKLGREPNVNNPFTQESTFRQLPSSKFTNPVRDAMAAVSEKSRKFGAERIEGPAIDAAFNKEFLPRFKQNSNAMYHELQKAIDPAMGTRSMELQQAIDAFKAARGQMSPDDLREILKPGARARRAARAANPNPTTSAKPYTPDWADDLVTSWEDKIIDSVEAGTKNSTDIFFDYTANNPVDKLGQAAFAFHRFPINSLPKSLRAAGKNPVYANVPTEYYRSSDQYNQQHGLPRAFHGRMPLGPKLPNGMQASFDPLQYSPMSALIKNATRPASTVDDQGSPIGDVLEDLKGIGLGLNPLIDLPLHAAGVYGPDMVPGALRWSQPINAAAGVALGRPVDIEGPLKSVVGGLEQSRTGTPPFPYQDYLVKKRAAELAMEGQPTDRAAQDVANQQGAEGLLGFSGIVPGIKFLTDEERKIRANAALARAYRLAGNVTAAGGNPTKDAYDSLYGATEDEIRNFNNLSPQEQEKFLRDPQNQTKALAILAADFARRSHKPQDDLPPGVNPFGSRPGSFQPDPGATPRPRKSTADSLR